MTTTDLWPEIIFDPKPRGVRQIVEEAGRGIKEKTNGLIEFHVWPAQGDVPGFPFRFRCVLNVPRFDYDYLLLEVHASTTGFPVEVRAGGTGDGKKADDEASLLAALARVFRSEHTKDVIKNLISMATE